MQQVDTAFNALTSDAPRRGSLGAMPATAITRTLNACELDVVRLLMEDCDTAEIAEHLGLPASDVDSVVSRIVDKLRLRTRAELLAQLAFDECTIGARYPQWTGSASK